MNQSSSRELFFIVTQNCNYDCLFCHGEKLQGERIDLLSPADYQFLYSVGKNSFGIKSATITGGEPLLRNDIVDIVHLLHEENCDITINTNGSLLEKSMNIGKYIKHLNLSLHTLKKWSCYEQIVQRRNVFYSVVNNLKMFRKLFPKVEICLNISIAEGLNSSEEELKDLMEFAEQLNSSIRFIELLPSDSEGFLPLEYLVPFLTDRKFEKFSSLTKKEHNQYNDLIVSPDGKIMPSRKYTVDVDILHAVKSRDIVLTEGGIKDTLRLQESIIEYEKDSKEYLVC